jgi:hypothetical protein
LAENNVEQPLNLFFPSRTVPWQTLPLSAAERDTVGPRILRRGCDQEPKDTFLPSLGSTSLNNRVDREQLVWDTLISFYINLEFLTYNCFFFIFILFICAHIVGSFLPPFPHPLPYPPYSLPYPSLPGRNYSALITIAFQSTCSNSLVKCKSMVQHRNFTY